MSLRSFCSAKENNVSFDETSFHNFQIASIFGMKWISKGNHLHDTVKLEKSVGESQYWRVERQESDPFWSFHVISENGEKLYVSYDDKNDKITLELKDDSVDGKKRFFVITLYEDMSYIFQAQDDKNRHIKRHKGKLQMSATGVPDEKLRWLIQPEFDQVEWPCFSVENIVQTVEILSTNIKWISQDAQPNAQVFAGQTGGLQKWKMAYCPDSKMITFSTGGLFISSEKDIADFVFVEQLGNPSFREFKPKWHGFGFKLQNNGKWVGAMGDDDVKHLISKKHEKDALVWEMDIAQIPYQGDNGILLFPQIPGNNEEKQDPRLEVKNE